MKKIENFLRKNIIAVVLVMSLVYSAHSYFINKQNENLKAELIEERKPSVEEKTKSIVNDLYRNRQIFITENEAINKNIEKMENDIISSKNLIKSNQGSIFYIESMIRCEKANNWKENKDNCSENWENYPKK